MLYTKRVDFKVDEEMYQWIKDNAHENNISMAQVIRNVLNTFVKRNGEDESSGGDTIPGGI